MTTERSTSSLGDHFTIRDVVASYNTNAPTLAPGYECLPFEEVHAPVLDLLPDASACVLDMGAGTGRDAAWQGLPPQSSARMLLTLQRARCKADSARCQQ